ncbi:MAG: bifunctional riboflavin kinase/FAD synthetase [candidate division Zixibacteria bacterium]|nr:bifunctional riboflavin kinase/FAD synthetase [candidate division Zixibacteria bacterium]
MHVFLDIRKIDVQAFDKPVVSLGTFDGVHLGHQAIIKRLLERSKEKNKMGLLVTYEPHPQSVVAPESAPKVLTTLEEKLYLLEKLGVKGTLVINFDKEVSELGPEEFLEEILVKKLNVGEIIVGHDHAFGKNRTGKIELLAEASRKYNFQLEVIPAVYAENSLTAGRERISSTKIRKELKEGDFNKGIKMLGHSYPIWGKATKGKGRGKTLDYPTINLSTPPVKLLPKDGVYSAKVEIKEKDYFVMLYVGAKPTFGDSSRSVEAHLFDMAQDTIDSEVHLFVESWIREPQKFGTPALLKDQLKADEKKIKEMFHIN